MAPRELFPERNAQIIAKRKAGVGPREIARQMGLGPNIVAGVLHRAGLNSAPSGRGHGATEAFKDYAIQVMAERGPAAASLTLGVTFSAIYKWKYARAAAERRSA